ncbi:MAG TPA: porin [Candidatus Wunengus sp. YC60]|uniref:porin n=1 Tax=Candidatus Wunengus sp. YC60 TaxID=3367697 RepID=UPI0040272CA0
MKNLYKLGLAGILCSAMVGLTAPLFAEEAAPAVAPAEEEGHIANFFKSVEVSGFIDTYYSYNYSRPNDRRGSTPSFVRDGDQGDWLDVRAFDREDNSFTLDNVEISVFKPSTEKDPIGFGFTTNYGEIAQRITFVPSNGRVDGASGGDDFTISQGFVTYKAPIGKGLDFKFGKFATWIGAELWESVDNPNFSRSLLYQNAIPFTNTGLAVSYPLLDKLTATGYLVNGWDTFVDNNTGKTLGYQFNWAIAENTNFIVNGSHGPEQTDNSSNYRHFWDLIFAIKPFSKTAFNLNFDYGTEEDGAMLATVKDNGQWWGFSGIVNQDITDSFGLALRGEYLDDNDGARLGVDALNLWEITLTANIKIRENLLVRPEIRYDEGNQDVFNGRDNELTTAIDFAYMF